MIQKLGFLLLTIGIWGCSNNPYAVDIEDAKLYLKYQNIDSALRYSTPKEQIKLYNALSKQDSDLAQFCFPYALQVSTKSDSAFLFDIKRTYQHAFTKQISAVLDQKQKWRLQTFKQIQSALKRMHLLLPHTSIPSSVCFTYTQFAASAYASPKSIVLGQERYLGPQNTLIRSLPPQQFYDWIKEGMSPQFASSDALLVWLNTNVLKSKDENLAAEMIRWGKLLAILEICSPELKLSQVLRYSDADLEWATNAERGFWEYLVDQQALFKTDQELLMNLLNEGPYTIGLPKESPDRMGRFLGYRIVKQYIENEQPSLTQLLHTPYHQILKKYEVPQ